MSRSPRRAALPATLLSTALLAAACGSSSHPVSLAADPPPASCRTTVMSTIAAVAMRSYAEVASGRVINGSRAQAARAPALIRALVAGDPIAAASAANRLVDATQIAFLRVQRGGRLVVSIGHGPAIAGTSGVFLAAGRPVGRFAVAVQGASGYAAVVHGLTGATVLVRRGRSQLAGTLQPGPRSVPDDGVVSYRGVSYVVHSFTRPGYPDGSERISLLAPPALFRACAGTPAQTVANVLGPLAMRIYAHENASASEHATLAYMEASPAFTAAVAAGDAAATRAAIVTFFRSHRHVVRVRAFRGAQLITDLGGPYVLAPVSGTLHRNGRVIGSFLTAIQDDAGYVALARAYTGAAVILRVGSRQVPSSTLTPGPAAIPDRGSVLYRGRRYEAFSFNGTAFPGGTLRISLLVPVAG